MRAVPGTALMVGIMVFIGGPACPDFAQGHRLSEEFVKNLLSAAVEQTGHPSVYDGSYRKIAYPGGDVPPGFGVCTDLVIRAYRKAGIDLQVKVHEDMTKSFSSYPQLWGLQGPDANIDHRRVYNLQRYFYRAGAQVPVTLEPENYHPGDLVTWRLPGNLPHIGLVMNLRRADAGVPLIVHDIGRGPEVEEALFAHPITGHYRYGAE